MKISVYLFIFFVVAFGTTRALEKDRLKEFIKEYEQSYEKTNQKMNCLVYAIKKNDIEVAQFFFDKGERNLFYSYQIFSDTHFRHGLLSAIRKGDPLLVELILRYMDSKELNDIREYVKIKDKNCPPYEKDSKYAIYIAILECPNSCEILNLLIENGLDVNKCPINRVDSSSLAKGENYTTALSAAIAFNELNIMEILLSAGASLKMGNLLSEAVKLNNFNAVSLLLNYGADPFMDSNYAINLAMQKEYWDIVDLLLDAAVGNAKK